MVAPERPSREVLKQIQLAEKSNMEYAWIMDEDFMREAYTTLSLVASNTKKIKIGPGVTNPHTRHPGITALSIATLDEISNGRAILGMGFGGALLTIPFDIPVKRVSQTVESYLKIVIRLLNGEEVTYKSEKFNLSNAKLSFEPSHNIPIYIGTRGKYMMRLAGRLANGTLLAGVPLEYIPFAIDQIENGLEKSGRTREEFDIANVVALSMSKDKNEAIKLVKPFVTFLAAEAPALMLEQVGLTDEDVIPIRNAMSKGILEAAKYVTEDMVEIFSVTGTPDECMGKIEKFANAGITQIVFSSPFGPNIEETLNLLSEFIEEKK